MGYIIQSNARLSNQTRAQNFISLSGRAWILWMVFSLGAILLWLPLKRSYVVEDHAINGRDNPVLHSGFNQDQTGQDNHTTIMMESMCPRLSPITLHAMLDAPTIPLRSMTAILPVNDDSFRLLPDSLETLLIAPSRLQDIWIVTPEPLLSLTRKEIRRVLASNHMDDHPDISLHPWVQTTGETLAANVFRLACEVQTEWTLILDSDGLRAVSSAITESLLSPLAVPLPVGSKGFVTSGNNIYRVNVSNELQPVSYLLPPFVIPTSMVYGFPVRHSGVWENFGNFVSRSRFDGSGGLVLAASLPTDVSRSPVERPNGLKAPLQPSYGILPRAPANSDELTANLCDALIERLDHPHLGIFVLAFPFLGDLQRFSAAACRIQEAGHKLRVLIYHAPLDSAQTNQEAIFDSCHIQYDIPPVVNINFHQRDESDGLDQWMMTYIKSSDVLVTLKDTSLISTQLDLLIRHLYPELPLVKLPKEDLPYSSWMGMMSLAEWKNWNIPRVEVSIITKDRPKSLFRLLSSLSQSRYFADRLDLRINVDQPADQETMRIIDQFEWPHGTVFVHNRLLPGGLLPAVVESWYPHSNDTYGLILEDDVEVSPLFYAWIKLAVLRYRYGEPSNRSLKLFGISLYQQKNIELRPTGREPFNAQAVISSAGFPDRSTPYLSQIPCSWGALYFPEHWREFHAYLRARLAETHVPLAVTIVPGVRSNRWKRSWKKYFVELAYLRGYVMLYPNFDDFVSLSTNHVEVGSHVKVRTREKLEQFSVPLMPLSEGLTPMAGLMSMPKHTLPGWELLPILNLTGHISTSYMIARDGDQRRRSVFGCSREARIPFDAGDLLCDEYSKANAL